MQILNSKCEGDRAYTAGYQGQKVGLYATSLYAAKQAAVAHLKPSKKNSGLLWVELAEED